MVRRRRGTAPQRTRSAKHRPRLSLCPWPISASRRRLRAAASVSYTVSLLADGASAHRSRRAALMRILILGAGGHGQVVANVLRAQHAAGGMLEPFGYLDDDPAAQGSERLGLPVLGALAEL